MSGEHLSEAGAELSSATVPPQPPPAPDAELAAFCTDFPEHRALGQLLHAEGLPLPEDFGTLEDDLPAGLDALLCWPAPKLALCTQPSPADVSAWAAHGWLALDARTDAEQIRTALVERNTLRASQPASSKRGPRKANPRSSTREAPPSDTPPPPARRTGGSRK